MEQRLWLDAYFLIVAAGSRSNMSAYLVTSSRDISQRESVTWKNQTFRQHFQLDFSLKASVDLLFWWNHVSFWCIDKSLMPSKRDIDLEYVIDVKVKWLEYCYSFGAQHTPVDIIQKHVFGVTIWNDSLLMIHIVFVIHFQFIFAMVESIMAAAAIQFP